MKTLIRKIKALAQDMKPGDLGKVGNVINQIPERIMYCSVEIVQGSLHGGEEIEPGTLHGGEKIRPGILHFEGEKIVGTT